MAYTKVFAVHTRLTNIIGYVFNPEKTTALSTAIDYAADIRKTEKRLFQSGLNCQLETAYPEMMETKQAYGKADGVLGYHFIQSFAPGEVTAEQAHELGMEFARRCFGERFQAVVGTHLDHAHYHNHVVINSVSFLDGLKYHSSPKSYFEEIRGISDQICREHGLSVIKPDGHGKHYAEWKAEKENLPTWRGLIREDIDKAVRQSLTYPQFLKTLSEMGYEVKTQVKHMAVRPPGKERFVRVRSLGESYTMEAIRQRILSHRKPEPVMQPKPPIRRKMRYIGSFTLQFPRTWKGFRALYYHYLHILRAARSPKHRGTAFLFREDLRFIRQLSEQARLLCNHQIDTADDLAELRRDICTEMKELTAVRESLTAVRRKEQLPEQVKELTAKQTEVTIRLRQLRKEVGLCESILARAADMKRKMKQVQRQKGVCQKRNPPRREDRGGRT